MGWDDNICPLYGNILKSESIGKLYYKQITHHYSLMKVLQSQKHQSTPFEGQVLQLQHEPLNPKDRFAVIVCLDGKIVGRVPANLAPTFSPFLARECNTITTTITQLESIVEQVWVWRFLSATH